MKYMDLSKIQKKRDGILRRKYKSLGLNSKAIKYREYQRKYYEIMKARREKRGDKAPGSSFEYDSESDIFMGDSSDTFSRKNKPRRGIIVIEDKPPPPKRLKIDIDTSPQPPKKSLVLSFDFSAPPTQNQEMAASDQNGVNINNRKKQVLSIFTGKYTDAPDEPRDRQADNKVIIIDDLSDEDAQIRNSSEFSSNHRLKEAVIPQIKTKPKIPMLKQEKTDFLRIMSQNLQSEEQMRGF